MPAQFQSLPPELLPVIIGHILRPEHLHSVCLVNRTFYVFAHPVLYERIVIRPWQWHAKRKLIQLFETLQQNPRLARLVRRLEIRDFPKGLLNNDYEQLVKSLISSIENATNLHTCIFTRDGCLTSEILKTLQSLPQLRELEINGQHQDNYDPSILPQFNHLSKISLIMPSHLVISVLPAWIGATWGTLRSLTLICKLSNLVSDATLKGLPPLPKLEHLHLIGCPKVTQNGVMAVIDANITGIISLGLEGLSPQFDVSALSERCFARGGLTQLKSFTFALHPGSTDHTWAEGALDLLAQSPLEIFQLYSVGGGADALEANRLCRQLVEAHGHRMTRFSFSRLLLELSSIRSMCEGCPNLTQLFVFISSRDLNALGPILAGAQNLRTFHANVAQFRAHHLEEANALIQQCRPTVTQFGIDTKVYQVERQLFVDERGTAKTRPVLGPIESPEIPEQFMVVRV